MQEGIAASRQTCPHSMQTRCEGSDLPLPCNLHDLKRRQLAGIAWQTALQQQAGGRCLAGTQGGQSGLSIEKGSDPDCCDPAAPAPCLTEGCP